MATYVLSPKEVISDLLRETLDDPRTSRESTNSETFSSGQTSYTLTPTSGSVQTITSLTIGGVSQTKWKDYYWNQQGQKIELPSAASGEVIVNYKQGTGWIYPDKPKKTLSASSFPRINVLKSAGVESRFGQYNAPMEAVIALQIDLWVKADYIFTDSNGIKHANDKLTEYLSIKAKNALVDNEDKLHAYGYSLRIATSDRDMPFDEEYQAYHKLFIIEFNSLKQGEITI